jgi:hypothetical protein
MPAMKNPAATTSSLRIIAVMQILTVGIVFVPLAWLDAWHAWLGLGTMPDDALLRFAIRGAAFAQAGIGVLMWVMATDVVRFRPLVIACGWIYLVGGPAFYWIETVAGMPQSFCLFDSISCFFAGGILLAQALPRAGDLVPQN